MSDKIMSWLLEGDVSLQYLVHRDLLDTNHEKLQKLRHKIPKNGWGKSYLCEYEAEVHGHWGIGFYRPKWTSSHYTLLELKNIGCPLTKEIKATLDKTLDENIIKDGGIGASKYDKKSDTCINGMFINYACYYKVDEEKLHSVIDYIINQQMKDGGFNCQLSRSGAVHSSLHSTLSILEGLHEYVINGYTYRVNKVKKMMSESVEFILLHRLYKSDHSGKIIHESMTKFSYPNRWKYDVLRCLVYFAQSGVDYDIRMDDAFSLFLSKQSKEGQWPKQLKHPGKTYFIYEKASKASRMNTYRALVVLKAYAKYM